MSKSILYEKLYIKYKRYTDIAVVIGSDNIDSITRGKLPRFYVLASKFLPLNIVDILGYSYNDFLKDYEDHLRQFSKNKYNIIFEMYSKGYSINSYSKLIQISYKTSENYFKYDAGKIEDKTIWRINWITNRKTLFYHLKIDVIYKERFAKIIGNKDTLEELKELYSIPYPVLYYSNDLWHIAFWWI